MGRSEFIAISGFCLLPLQGHDLVDTGLDVKARRVSLELTVLDLRVVKQVLHKGSHDVHAVLLHVRALVNLGHCFPDVLADSVQVDLTVVQHPQQFQAQRLLLEVLS